MNIGNLPGRGSEVILEESGGESVGFWGSIPPVVHLSKFTMFTDMDAQRVRVSTSADDKAYVPFCSQSYSATQARRR